MIRSAFLQDFLLDQSFGFKPIFHVATLSRPPPLEQFVSLSRDTGVKLGATQRMRLGQMLGLIDRMALFLTVLAFRGMIRVRIMVR
jgi:hypothetical protein